MNRRYPYHFPLYDLLLHLKARGYYVSPRVFADIEQLLLSQNVYSAGDEKNLLTLDKLEIFLTPIIARNRKEQEEIQAIIRGYVAEERKQPIIPLEPIPQEEEPLEKKKNRRISINKKSFILVGTLISLLIIALVAIIRHFTYTIEISNGRTEYTIGDTATIYASIKPKKLDQHTIEWLYNNSIFDGNAESIKVVLENVQDDIPIVVRLKNEKNEIIAYDSIDINVLPQTSTLKGKENNTNVSSSPYNDYPYFHIILYLFFIFLICVLYPDPYLPSKNIHSIALDRQSLPWVFNKGEPYDIEFTNKHHLIQENRAFTVISSTLRARQEIDLKKLDVIRSVHKSSANAGFPFIVWEPKTKTREYLIFIDRKYSNSHLASLFEWFVNKLKREGIYLEKYYYEGAPNKLNDGFGHFVTIEKLGKEKADYLLIIFGDCQGFFGEINIVLHKWIIENLAAWETKAVITTVPLLDWSFMESQLIREGFLVVPAEIEAIESLSQALVTGRVLDKNIHKKINDFYSTAFYNFEDITDLRDYLQNDKLMQWICALAVYPALNWQITVSLGVAIAKSLNERMETKEDKLVIDYNTLLKISRINWLHTGDISEELRLALLKNLDRDIHVLARVQIVHMLLETRDKLNDSSLALVEWNVQYIVNTFFLYASDPVRYARYQNAVDKIKILWPVITDHAVREITNDGKNNLMPRKSSTGTFLNLNEYFEQLAQIPSGIFMSQVIVIALLALVFVVLPVVIEKGSSGTKKTIVEETLDTPINGYDSLLIDPKLKSGEIITNDNCSNAYILSIPDNGFGYDIISITNNLSQATVELGETFAPAVKLYNQTQKSVWYKFSLPKSRAIRVELTPASNSLLAGDAGFAVYETSSCLPTKSEISKKLTAIGIFGNSYHPCVDPGDYLIQVSAKANGSITITLAVLPAECK